jgi:hypothetical protein
MNNDKIMMAVVISAVFLMLFSTTTITLIVYGEKKDTTTTSNKGIDNNKKVKSDSPLTTTKDKKGKATATIIHTITVPKDDDNNKVKPTFDISKNGIDGSLFKPKDNTPLSQTITPTVAVTPIQQQQQQDNTNKGTNTVVATQEDKKDGFSTTTDNTKREVKDTVPDKTKDTPKTDTTTVSKNDTSGNSDSGSSVSGSKGGEGGGPVTGNNNGSTTPTLPPPPFKDCGPGMKLDKKDGKTCVLDKNCEFKDKNQTVIACVNTITKKVVIHENHHIHNEESNTVINNNNNNFVNTVAVPNIFTNNLLSSNTGIIIPKTLLLLDSRQLLDLAGDTNNAAIQTLFCTTSIKSTYSEQTRTWFITGTVQNINVIDNNAISNMHLTAAFYDINGNHVATIPNIAVTPDTLAHDQEGSFTFSAALDTDLSGIMPTFITIGYNM